MSSVHMCFYGVRAEDVECLTRKDDGSVDITVKSKGMEARMFLRPEVVRMIGAMALGQDKPKKATSPRVSSAAGV